jgi:D-3-phosphoglycerate dehydrogenase
MKIAITTTSFAQYNDEPLRLLRERGIESILNPYGRVLTENEAVDLLRGCVAVAAGTEALTAGLMDALPELRVISRCGVGMDNVDMEAASRRGILVRNTPGAPTRAVVELTLGYALDLMRHISLMDRDIRNRVWKKRMGALLHGKKLGIIGFGRIGKAVAEAFSLMGCRVHFHDPFIDGDQGVFQRRELDSLLAWADIVTLHCSAPADGSKVLDAARIAVMKEGACLINAARGGLVDEDALAGALRSERLSGAALDVFTKEPYSGPLADLPNVILTPHIGAYAVETRVQMEIDTIRNLLEALEQAGISMR